MLLETLQVFEPVHFCTRAILWFGHLLNVDWGICTRSDKAKFKVLLGPAAMQEACAHTHPLLALLLAALRAHDPLRAVEHPQNKACLCRPLLRNKDIEHRHTSIKTGGHQNPHLSKPPFPKDWKCIGVGLWAPRASKPPPHSLKSPPSHIFQLMRMPSGLICRRLVMHISKECSQLSCSLACVRECISSTKHWK